MNLKRISINLLLIILFSNLVFAIEYPLPINFVSDYTDALSEAEESELNALIDQIEKDTTVEIAVVLINNSEGNPVEKYAFELFEQWGVGKKGADNGLLILISVEDREYRIEVGYGLEEVLPDSRTGRIARENFIPNFKEEKYAAGIKDALSDIKGILQNEPSVIAKYPSEKENLFYVLLGIILIIAEAAFIYVMEKRKKIKMFDLEMHILSTCIVFVILMFINLVVAFFYILFYKPTYIFLRYLSNVQVPKGGHKSKGRTIMLGGKRLIIGGSSSGGNFGGFGGGRSGGGGASGRW